MRRLSSICVLLRATCILGLAAVSCGEDTQTSMPGAPGAGSTGAAAPGSASAGSGSTDGAPVAVDGPFVCVRLDDADPRGSQRRASRDNRSAPLWDPSASPFLRLATAEGARLRFEVTRRSGRRRPLAPPQDVEAVFRTDEGEHRFAGTAAVPTDAVRPWFDVEVPLPAGLDARGRWSIILDGKEATDDGAWLVTVPRLYAKPDAEVRPNVLWITVDTLRADFLGCYGHTRPTSPRIDELAEQSVLFERCIAQACWTLPSYVSALTGLVADAHGVLHRNRSMFGHLQSIAEVFSQEGYGTAAVVSGTFTDSYWGMDQGFDEYDDLGQITDDNVEADVDLTHFEGAEERITSPLVTAKATAWLREHQDERFFLLVHYFDPHGVYREHEEYRELLPPEPPRPMVMRWNDRVSPTPDVPLKRACYEQEIAFTDRWIGELLDALDELGLADDTVVVLSADHGEEFFERFSVGHGHSIFNELARVPFLWRVPGVEPRRVAEPVGNVDMAPTLAELCGLDWPAARPGGESLVSTWSGGAPRSSVVVSSWHNWDVDHWNGRGWMRLDEKGYTYLHGRDPATQEERAFLFAADDLAQAQNLIEQLPEMAARFAELEQSVDRALVTQHQQIRAAAGSDPGSLELDEDILEKLRRLDYVDDESDEKP